MPSSRAVLADIVAFGLNPGHPHSVLSKSGHLNAPPKGVVKHEPDVQPVTPRKVEMKKEPAKTTRVIKTHEQPTEKPVLVPVVAKVVEFVKTPESLKVTEEINSLEQSGEKLVDENLGS